MNFVGYDFLCDVNAFVPQRSNGLVSILTLTNGIYDDCYLSSDPFEYTSDSMEWDINTIIYSDFNSQNYLSGNLPFLLADITRFRLKRREVGTFEWTGIYEHVIDSVQNVNFTYIDRYARGRGTEHEYCIVPVTADGTEQSYNYVRAVSDFDGAVISDKNTSYHILLEPSVIGTIKNRSASVITTMNSKYPFVFYGSDANYYSGSFSGVAIKQNGDAFDPTHSVQYRDEFLSWLTNGQAKILKLFDGRIWMININGNITSDCSEHYDKVAISFEFIEIGDVTSTEDLYNNNFTDYII